MSRIIIPGSGPQLYYPFAMNNPIPAFVNTTIAATGDKIAICGPVMTGSRLTKNITKVHWLWGTVTKAGGSGMTFSLQDIDPGNGTPMRPDGVQDQTFAIANGNSGFVTNGWFTTGALSSLRPINNGDMVAAVLEYDGSGRLGSDTVTIRGMNVTGSSSLVTSQLTGLVVQTGGTWAITVGVPNIIFEFDDGTFGSMYGGIAASVINTHNFKQDTTVADEYALAVNVPWAMNVDAFILPLSVAGNTSDFAIIAYDGTSPMTNGTRNVDANTLQSTSGRGGVFPWGGEMILLPGHQYFFAIQPTQTNGTVTVASFDMNNYKHIVAHPGGIGIDYATRLNSGAWNGVDGNPYSSGSSVNTRRLNAGLVLSSLSDDASNVQPVVYAF